MIRFLLLIAMIGYGYAEPQKRLFPHSLTTTIIIPCNAFHFPYLWDLLESYASQTSLPNQISISLSDCNELDSTMIDRLERAAWPFQLKISRHKGSKTAGENRNWAKSQARGDIIIAQDADDIPHPQRVEIVKFFFENYEIDHLIHSWAPNGKFVPYEKENLPIYQSTPLQIYEGFRQEDGTVIPLHNGNICFSKEFGKFVHWDLISDGAEDVRFNYLCYKMSKKTFLTPLGLIHFVENRSYFRRENY